MNDDPDDGLARDLKVFTHLAGRRQVLRWMTGASLLPLLGCNAAGADPAAAGRAFVSASDGGTCATIPEETAGPFHGNGTNGTNALALSGIVRRDIRASLGGEDVVAAGVPLTVQLSLVNTNGGCAPLAGCAVYLWHGDREAKYSMYELPDRNYLRGVQASDAHGRLSFSTIFPGCYPGRMPHLHFEVYPSVAQATASASKLKTSQLALPVDVCRIVYGTTAYGASLPVLEAMRFGKDGIFTDGYDQQVMSVTGSLEAGYVATLIVGVPA